MLSKPQSTAQEARLLLEVLLTGDKDPSSMNACIAPLTIEAFREYLTFGTCDKSLGHCLDFLDWLKDYTLRFEQLTPDIQAKSPPVGPQGNSQPVSRPAVPEMNQVTTPTTPRSPEATVNPSKQPLRGAVDFCQMRYLNPGAPANLQIPLGIRDRSIDAIKITTHPSAFAGVADHCRDRLALNAMPAFVSGTLKNLTPRAAQDRYLISVGLFTLTISLIALGILLGWPRWARLALAPILFIAVLIATLAPAGFCVYRYFRRVRDGSGYLPGDALVANASPFDDLESAKAKGFSSSSTSSEAWGVSGSGAIGRRQGDTPALVPVRAPLILRLQRRLLMRLMFGVAIPITTILLICFLIIPERIGQ